MKIDKKKFFSLGKVFLTIASSSWVAEKVTVDNFVRAETDMTFKRYEKAGGFGKMFHLRQPTPLDKRKTLFV